MTKEVSEAVMTYRFPDRQRAGWMGLFYFGAPLSFVFGGPLPGFILSSFDGAAGLHGYQRVFLIDAMPGKGVSSTVVGFVVAIPWACAIAAVSWLPLAPVRSGEPRGIRPSAPRPRAR